MPEVRIGTSGWNYSHWRRLFYPQGLKQAEWLNCYSHSFDTVEINATFYRLPKPEYVRRWAQQTPEGFLFAVKGSRYLTHIKRMGDTGESLDRFFDLAGLLEEKAGPVLWQLPPSMRRDDDRLAAFAGALPGGWRHTFEFRHASWFCREVYGILERAGAALCIPIHPELPRDELLTADWSYFRFHFGGSDGLFTMNELAWWASVMRGFTDEGADIYAYFNNDWEGYALRNARELAKMLKV